jgi:DNA-binding transcriptional LysR family regulator
MQMSDRIGRRMKLHDLHVLMAVVQVGSMRKTAALLNTTQSAISRSIADLEQTIGARLLDRSSQGIEPTRYGRALFKRSVAVFDELKQGVQEIEFLSNPEAGELLIGSGSAFAEGFVLAIIERLSHRYPHVAYHLMPGALLALYDQLRERRIELAFSGDTALDRQDDIDAEVLFEEPLAVAANAGNPWVRRRRVQLADLVNEPWTWSPPGTVVDRLIVEAFRSSGLDPPRATVYTDAINVRIRLTASRGFLTVVPASVLSFPGKHEALRRLPIELPTTRRQMGILTLKNRTLSPLAELFIECARDIANPLAKSTAHTVRNAIGANRT